MLVRWVMRMVWRCVFELREFFGAFHFRLGYYRTRKLPLLPGFVKAKVDSRTLDKYRDF